ncbi:MAG: transcription-repair coupling factor [Prevotella sp.]|nr:transcription-repair coupling factor [Prevotella sp.]
MKVQDLINLYAHSPQSAALAKALEDVSLKHIFLQGLSASAPAVLFASVTRRIWDNEQSHAKTVVFILPDADDAGYFYHDLTQMLGSDRVFYYPSSYRRQVKYGQRDAANEILRTEVLAKLSAPTQEDGIPASPFFIITHPEALSELVVSKQKLAEKSITLKTGDEMDVSELESLLIGFGFKEVDYVYEPGQFALRGSILDVYSFSSEYPFRIDFFGDEIDSIRTFEVESQLSKDKRPMAEIVPELADAGSKKTSFMTFLHPETILVAKDFLFVRDIIERTFNEGFASQAITERLEGIPEMERQQILQDMKAENMLLSGSQYAEETQPFRKVEFGSRASAAPDATIRCEITPQPLFHKNFELLASTLQDYMQKGYHLYILADSQKQQERLKDIFNEIASKGHPDILDYPVAAKGIEFTPVDHTIHEGFVNNALKLCIFTDHQIFDRFHKYNLKSDAARTGKVALTLKELQEMEPGDYIVHVDLGIGRFAGLVRVPIPPSPGKPHPSQDAYQEVIRIIYANNDKVDVSIHSLYKISKYKRRDSETPPRLSTIGTGAWERMKERTKKRIKDIARDLIKLYAARRHEKGFAFSADSFMQHELEASFLYEDTPDQLKATNDVKADMESARPMDRLVCGDVGFGKTEVAIRAAFKAACDSKQVAVLVPTTVLAYQHYQTFTSRLKELPVNIDYLSRARSAKKTKEILTDLASGKIDIIIGTHKLIGKSVKFHDLGLLIIDEEQKFGVAVKEKLRKMKVNVDTLTMSATPIPRTLQFSLMGARDMSIIQTPPPNRYPIHTEIHTFNGELIGEAINFEMSRNGQVFFVNDRISNLPEIAKVIEKYVPGVRIAIGHGQMKPEELEKTVMGFINYDYDVLLSTTIVENGIDIPNANTIIINDAHRFGLSDLHQMRGRVGRSNKKSFCYLLAPPMASINQDSRRRLEALETFSELGSGFNLSMQDLDIRGAGNLLGAEQSGFMEDLGYETYQKILSQAVTELKNDEFANLFATEETAEHPAADTKSLIDSTQFVDDCSIESDLEMYFPELYVPSSSERMLLYRQLDSIKNDEDLEKFKLNLRDRFGEIPIEGLELLQVVPLRRLGKQLGCEKIMLKKGQLMLYFVSNPNSPYYQSSVFDSVLNFLTRYPRRCQLKEVNGKRSMVIMQVGSVKEAVEILRGIINPEPNM